MLMTRRSFTTGLAAAPALVPGLALGQVPVERVFRHGLANGLEVVAIPDHRVPVATHMLWYRVGSADEVHGKSGLAHFLEHLMFKGTKRNPKDVFSRAVTSAGGNENAFTSYDYTGYFQRVVADQLPVMMDFEADRIANIVLTDEVVLPERDVVQEERRQRTDNDPGARLSERLLNRLWGEGHPYGIPIIGWANEIAALSREDALAFYRRHYGPNNAILVVAGDVTPDEVFRMAEETYGRVDANPAIQPRSRPPGPAREAGDRVRLADARVRQPSLSKTSIVRSYRTAAPGEAEALEILAQIAGSSPNGRFYKALVTDQGLAVGAGCFYSGSALGDGRFGVYASPRPGVPLERLEAAMADVAVRLADHGVTDEELARARTRLIAESVYSQDSQASMARMYGASLTCGASIADIQQWPQRIAAVTRAEVDAVARRAFDFSRAVTGELVREERS
ncbi:MAG: insulinase family protein [Phreatobacter sp.]|uniref:M16 family metallopeptidase n=1 Tax=Phreatobacter sp. TaxID=1966341 RepID=UPI001A62CA25|nr:pitrilysin family protein [Phreatobacter sp.]MBL8569217.1 insulinase family protein [Phreatobacter sp.]